MSSPSPVLVSGIATLSVATQPLPSGNAPQASVSVVVTDSGGTVYPAVVLTGAETPTPWSYAATFASGAATAVATALDTSGNPIGSAATLSFTVTPAVTPQTFSAPSGFGFVAAASTPATAALHKAASVKT
jgi:hypothetical protein